MRAVTGTSCRSEESLVCFGEACRSEASPSRPSRCAVAAPALTARLRTDKSQGSRIRREWVHRALHVRRTERAAELVPVAVSAALSTENHWHGIMPMIGYM